MSRWSEAQPGPDYAALMAQLARNADLPPPPAGGGRRWLYVLLGLVLVAGALVAGAFIAWWIYMHIVITIPIRNQPTGVDLPERFNATANVSNDLQVAMKGAISTSVPFNQDLVVPFRGRYDFDVEMNAKVPVEFDVAYDGILPVDTEADVQIRTSINYKNLKALRNLNIETTLPLTFPLPVQLLIPVKDTIDLEYAGPLSADINQDITTRVDTVLRTTLPIDQTITTPVSAALPLEIRPDVQQVRLILSEMLVELRPSQMLRFGFADADAETAERVDNPYGPRDQLPNPAAP